MDHIAELAIQYIAAYDEWHIANEREQIDGETPDAMVRLIMREYRIIKGRRDAALILLREAVHAAPEAA